MQDLGIEVLLQGTNAWRLLQGLFVSIKLAMISMLLSVLLGTLMGMIMTNKNRLVKFVCRLYLETVRIMPQLVLLFLVYFGAAKHFGIDISGELSAIVVFTFWGTAEMGDIVRGALVSIPKHQYESAYGLGLKKWQTFVYVIIPQTIRRLLPASINLLTRMIKTTSLVVLIGVVEVVKVGKQIIDASRFEVPTAALWIYGTIFILYFLVCFPISRLSIILEKRLQV